ncbi:MAG: MptD family putative ECF transporter S component [[Eubacterium] sulci]|nr:MptD family putative ECF transporter S component [[Eubacterium] sulci]
MNDKKLKIKDLVTIGVFAIICFVVMFAVGMMGVVPILFLIYPTVLGVVSGTIVMLFMAKEQKPWALFIMGILQPLAMFVMGQTYVIVLHSIVVFLIAEALRRAGNYNSFRYNMLAFAVYNTWICGSMMQMIWAKEKYIELHKMMGKEYVESIERLITYPHMALVYLGAIVGGIIGAYIGRGLLKKHFTNDMYPLYWTPSKEGIFMRYSHEYKLECIELYRQGIWPETPEGIKTSNFHQMVRYWVRIEEQNGPDALKHLGNNKVWTPEAKYELVAKVLAGQSYKSVAVSAGINNGMLYTWVRKYKELGYNGLVNEKKGRKSKNPDMKKKTIEPKPLTESEREELIRLRAEIAAMKAEIEVVKKRIALRQERWAAQLKAKKQQSSKRSEKKDTN